MPQDRDRDTTKCPKCRSVLVRELMFTTRLKYFQCEECGEVFTIERPEPPARERRSDPERKRKP